MGQVEKMLHAGKAHTSSGGRDGIPGSGAPTPRTLAGSVTPGWSEARADREPPTRLMVGFIAGFLSVLTLQSV